MSCAKVSWKILLTRAYIKDYYNKNALEKVSVMKLSILWIAGVPKSLK
jgi:hypothetical protein